MIHRLVGGGRCPLGLCVVCPLAKFCRLSLWSEPNGPRTYARFDATPIGTRFIGYEDNRVALEPQLRRAAMCTSSLFRERRLVHTIDKIGTSNN